MNNLDELFEKTHKEKVIDKVRTEFHNTLVKNYFLKGYKEIRETVKNKFPGMKNDGIKYMTKGFWNYMKINNKYLTLNNNPREVREKLDEFYEWINKDS